ncbi:hypothetical protein ACWD50_26710, partial [Micromonospora sp. NPDC005113]
EAQRLPVQRAAQHQGVTQLLGHVLGDPGVGGGAMQTSDVNTRWQAEMAPYFVGLDHGAADRAIRPLDEVFNLEAQLSAERETRLAAQTGETP